MTNSTPLAQRFQNLSDRLWTVPKPDFEWNEFWRDLVEISPGIYAVGYYIKTRQLFPKRTGCNIASGIRCGYGGSQLSYKVSLTNPATPIGGYVARIRFDSRFADDDKKSTKFYIAKDKMLPGRKPLDPPLDMTPYLAENVLGSFEESQKLLNYYLSYYEKHLERYVP